MRKGKLLYSGKAKSIYETGALNEVIMHFRDDISAFDGEKTEQMARKGEINNKVNAFIMGELNFSNSPFCRTHFIRLLNEQESLVKKLEMVPIECIIRNRAAGHLCSRIGVEEGSSLGSTIYELALKDDKLHDPMINESYCEAFCWADSNTLKMMKQNSGQINTVLKKIFDKAGYDLIDFKLEFGKDSQGRLCLGDEFTFDSCRVWEKGTDKKMDKDRFRKDLGGVIEHYEELAKKIGVEL